MIADVRSWLSERGWGSSDFVWWYPPGEMPGLSDENAYLIVDAFVEQIKREVAS